MLPLIVIKIEIQFSVHVAFTNIIPDPEMEIHDGNVRGI
jgi:hypothetical protein